VAAQALPARGRTGQDREARKFELRASLVPASHAALWTRPLYTCALSGSDYSGLAWVVVINHKAALSIINPYCELLRIWLGRSLH
jgi:hypothetical protein